MVYIVVTHDTIESVSTTFKYSLSAKLSLSLSSTLKFWCYRHLVNGLYISQEKHLQWLLIFFLSFYAEGDGQQSTANSSNNWKGVFSVSSYTQFFNVDTDIVLNRLTSSLYPSGDFFSKIDANPDL